ncbi:MAG: alpha/beta hydrolase family protein, partial [Planctomycetota bacterium]
VTDLPETKVESLGIIRRPGYKIEKLILKPEDGIYLPALMFSPERAVSGGTVLYIHENGKAEDAGPGGHAGPGGQIEKLVEAGKTVLAVDLRGTGETQKTNQKSRSQFGPDSKDVYTAYLLGRSYVGMRAEDILICARFLQQQKDGRVDLVTVGHVSVPALHAAALESDMFGSIKLMRGLASWSNVIEMGRSNNQLVNTVHGALTVYDLGNLAATLGDSLSIEEPLNAQGEREPSR